MMPTAPPAAAVNLERELLRRPRPVEAPAATDVRRERIFRHRPRHAGVLTQVIEADAVGCAHGSPSRDRVFAPSGVAVSSRVAGFPVSEAWGSTVSAACRASWVT